MGSTYSKYLIGPNVENLANFPLVDYNPLLSPAEQQAASDAALKTYLGDAANRHAYNQSFTNIKADYYSGSTHVGYVNPESNQLVCMPGGSGVDISAFYNTKKFGEDMLNSLVEKNVDFAHYVLNDTPAGTELETVITESGEYVSVDPSFSGETMAQMGIGGLLAGLCLPGIGYGIRNIKTGDKKKKALGFAQLGAGLGTTSWFASNLINSASLYSSTNLVDVMLGMKGLWYNSGMFLIGNGIYNLISSFKDYKKDHANKGRSIAKGAMGGLEIASGACFVSAGTTAMTSLIYEGSGLFAISTQGLATILSTTIPFGIGLGIAALVAGAFYIKSWYKNKKAKKTHWLS